MVVDRTRPDSHRAALDAFRRWIGTPTLTPQVQRASRAEMFRFFMVGATCITAMRFTRLGTASRRCGQTSINRLARLTPKSTAGTRHPQDQDWN